MNTGKTLFLSSWTSAMDYFHADRRPVWRRHRVRTLSCAAIPVHGLRPLTYGKACATSSASRSTHRNLSHGLPPAGPALDAGLPTKGATGYPCGVGPAAHHPGEDAVRRRRTGVGPDQYRLRPGLDDHRSVPVGLSVGALPHHQGGGEDAHAARPAGQHSEFYPHLGWQAARRSCPRYALAGSRSHPSWIVATSTLPAFMCCKPGPSARVPSRTSMLNVYSAPTDRSTGIICDQTISLDGFYTRQDYPELLRRIRFRTPSPARRWSSSPTTSRFRRHHLRALQKPLAGGTLLQVDQAATVKQFYGTSENAVKTQIWIAVSNVLVAIVKKRLDLDASLYTLLQILSVTLFEKMPIHQALAGDENRCNASQITNQLNLFDFLSGGKIFEVQHAYSGPCANHFEVSVISQRRTEISENELAIVLNS